MYYCKLVHNGWVQEGFYRDGESASEVLKDLECFEWPEGTWTVEDLEEGE